MSVVACCNIAVRNLDAGWVKTVFLRAIGPKHDYLKTKQARASLDFVSRVLQAKHYDVD